MHALDLLIADHNRCRGLFARFKDAHANDDADAMSAVFLKIFQDLEVHTTIEEEIFYPMVRDTNDDIARPSTRASRSTTSPRSSRRDQAAARRQRRVDRQGAGAPRERGAPHRRGGVRAVPAAAQPIDKDRWRTMAERFEARKAELGAPTLADKIDLTKDELLELARDQQIPGRSKMSQEELAATVAPARSLGPPARHGGRPPPAGGRCPAPRGPPRGGASARSTCRAR